MPSYPKYYISDAISDLRQNAINAASITPVYSALSDLFASLLEVSQRFYLPNGGWLFDNPSQSQFDLHQSLFRLPYSVIAAEYDSAGLYSKKDYAIDSIVGSVDVPKRIAIAFEPYKLPQLNSFASLPNNCCVISAINFLDGKWILGSHSALVRYEDIEESDFFDFVLDKNIIQENQVMSLKSIGLGNGIPMSLDSYIISNGEIGDIVLNNMVNEKGIESEKARLIFQLDLNDEFVSILQLCAALNCENTYVETCKPSPTRSLLKKHRKNKLIEYKTINIKVPKQSSERNSKNISGEKRSSPRLHLRRGHIRRYKSKYMWINATFVGSASLGAIYKDYSLNASNS